MMHRIHWLAFAMSGLCLVSARNAGAGIVNIDVPNATATEARGINNSGAIVGNYLDGEGDSHGFYLDHLGGTFTTIDVPGALNTFVFGINNLGEMVGSYGTSLNGETHGFLLPSLGGSATSFDIAGAFATQAFGINDAGQIVGGFFQADRVSGFLLDSIGGTPVVFDFGTGNYTSAQGINDAGQIVGGFGTLDLNGNDGFISSQGFYLQTPASQPTAFGVGSAPVTVAMGINDQGVIAGFYADQSGNLATGVHGLIMSSPGGRPTTFDVPGSPSTVISGLNDLDIFVGAFNGSTRGFAFVPEPSSLGLLSTACLWVLAGCAWSARDRTSKARAARREAPARSG
jgi:uncharacterized membrane protein